MDKILRKLFLFFRNAYIGIPNEFFSVGLVLGTSYGKKFVVNQSLEGSKIISAGVGKDISWDQDLANSFQVNICLVDPTPISKKYVLEKFNQKEELILTNNSTIKFLNFALWNKDTTIELYSSEVYEHNDFSVHNLQKTKYDKTLLATSMRVVSLMKLLKWRDLDIIKLDIEGAALEVLTDMFNCGIKPKQVLIEIDELFQKSLWSFWRARKYFRLLKSQGYSCVYRNYFDFTFVVNDFVNDRV
jgi:FkbM family methyltransferase